MNYATAIGNIITFKWRRADWPEGQHIFYVQAPENKAIGSFAECVFLAESGQDAVQWAPTPEDEAAVNWTQFTPFVPPAPEEEHPSEGA
jgi:hypothetical protein